MIRRATVGQAAIAILFVVCNLQASPLWGTLEPGPYQVGYRTIFTHDLSRPSIKIDATGRTITPAQLGRQMQIGVWYPANNRTRQPFMRFEQYVHLLSQELNFSSLTIAQQQEAVATFLKDYLGRGSSKDKLETLLRTNTRAIQNASAINTRFPLVVYAHIPPSGNSIMCEFLASHGFVVAAVPWKGTFEYNLDVGLTGVETQMRDIEFVVGLLRNQSNVAGDKIATIGMSFGAISSLGLQTRNSDIDAVISLDGGVGSAFGAAMVQRTSYYAASRMTAPLLHLYGSNVPGTDLSYLHSLKYSRRYFVAFSGMRHGDFTNQGILEHFAPGTKEKPPGDSKTGFEWVSRYSLHFLNAYLKNDQQGITFLSNINGAPKETCTIEIRENLPAPPTAQQLQAIFQQNGIARVVALYSERKLKDPQPIPQQTLSDVARWLVERDDLPAAKQIVDLRLDSYSTSAWASFAAADIYRRLGNNDHARKLFEDALRLLPTDFDPEIDFNRRRAIYEGSKRQLESLNRQ